ncbi:MAG: gliding motility-associated C-terminal domain-containing protein [Bacteroidia bacterium]
MNKRVLVIFFFFLCFFLRPSLMVAQSSPPFNSGVIPMCDTTFYTTLVSGIDTIFPLGQSQGPSQLMLDSLLFNLSSNHPQTLKITLTSPQGTVLLLSAFNGSGGSNYINTIFTNASNPNITTAAAPFSGYWYAEGGSLSVFDWENANGTWTITIIDTACNGGGSGGGLGTLWTNGFFHGAAAGSPGGFGSGLGFAGGGGIGPNPCPGSIPSDTLSICPGSTFNLNNYYVSSNPSFFYSYSFLGSQVANPSSISTAGVYFIGGWDFQNACMYNGTFELKFLFPPNLGPDQVANQYCNGTPQNLSNLFNLSGLTEVSWTHNGSPIPFSSAYAATSLGVYQLVVQDVKGCYDTVEVTMDPPLAVNIGTDQNDTVCSGTSINLTSYYNTTGLTSTWYFNGLLVPNPNSVSLGGDYTLVVSDFGGCTDTAIISLTLLPVPSLGNNLQVSTCSAGNVDLTILFNTTGFSTSWTYGGVPVVNPTSIGFNGQYMLVASNGGLCFDTAFATVLISQKPNLGPDVSTLLCDGSTKDLTVLLNPNGNTTSWFYSGVPISPPTAVSLSGIYTLIITNTAGCSDTADVVVTVTPSPILGVDQSHIICSNTPIDLTSLYNTSGFASAWAIGSATVANPSQVSTPSNYSLIASDGNGCADTAIVSLSVLIAPTLGVDQNFSICTGDDIDLTSVFNTTGYIASWSFSGNLVPNPNSVQIDGAYQLLVTSANGCMDTALVQLTVFPNPSLGADQSLDACDGILVNLNSLFNTVGLSLSWTMNSSLVTDPTQVINPGLFELIATNGGGCTDTATLSLTFLPKPNLGIDQSITSCDGIAVDLTILYSLNGLTSSWTFAGNPISNSSAILTAGTYELIANNASGCLDTSLVIVNMNPLPVLGPDATYALCSWQTLDLSQVYHVSNYTALYSYLGNPALNYTSVYDSGYYSVFVTDANGCTNQATIEVTHVFCRCDADFEFTANCVQEPLSFKLLADSMVLDAHWNFSTANTPDVNEPNPTVYFKSEGKHLVTLQATLSCGVSEVTKWVEVKDCSDSCRIWIPNSFSPNDDGKNEYFGFHSECQPEQFKANIYDRFGKLIYQSNSIVNNWDGKIDGEYITSGIFVYRIECKMPYKDEEILTGKITIIR